MKSKQEKFDDLLFHIKEVIPCCNEVAGFIASQIMIETAWLNSDILLHANNLFGMRFPKIRVTFATDEYKGHALYTSRWLSLADYALWLQYNNFQKSDLMDLDVFLDKMKNTSFNNNVNYYPTIMSIFKQYYYEH